MPYSRAYTGGIAGTGGPRQIVQRFDPGTGGRRRMPPGGPGKTSLPPDSRPEPPGRRLPLPRIPGVDLLGYLGVFGGLARFAYGHDPSETRRQSEQLNQFLEQWIPPGWPLPGFDLFAPGFGFGPSIQKGPIKQATSGQQWPGSSYTYVGSCVLSPPPVYNGNYFFFQVGSAGGASCTTCVVASAVFGPNLIDGVGCLHWMGTHQYPLGSSVYRSSSLLKFRPIPGQPKKLPWPLKGPYPTPLAPPTVNPPARRLQYRYTSPTPGLIPPRPVIDPWGWDEPVAEADSMPQPSPYMPPYRVPSTDIQVGPDGPLGPAKPGTHDHLPPPKGVRESKKVFPSNSPLQRMYGSVTEIGDATDAIAKALPGNPCRGLPLHKKILCVMKHAPDLLKPNIAADAFWNVVADQAEDYAFGRYGRAMRNSLRRNYKAGYYPNSPHGLGFGGWARRPPSVGHF